MPIFDPFYPLFFLVSETTEPPVCNGDSVSAVSELRKTPQNGPKIPPQNRPKTPPFINLPSPNTDFW